jgi:hypothetical protein
LHQLDSMNFARRTHSRFEFGSFINFDGMFKSAFLKSESGEKWHTQAGICIIFFQVIVCTHEGEVLKEGRIPTEREDIEEFFSGLERLEISYGSILNTNGGSSTIWTSCWSGKYIILIFCVISWL